MKIDRCICNDISFAEVLQISKNIDSVELHVIKEHVEVCNGCRMCEPYLRDSLKTGITCYNASLKE